MQKKSFLYHLFFFFLILFFCTTGQAQPNILRGIGNRGMSGGGSGGAGGDSLKRRNQLEDSITINFRFLDTGRTYLLDSSVHDFNRRFPIPTYSHYLGNIGTAARPVLFSPVTRAGWDPGFHAFDLYRYSIEKVRFFNTTRPYTELGYILGSQTQQLIEVIHTQNLKPYWNASMQYRLISSPGFFKNQNTAHNNYQLTSWYQSPNKRYNNYLVLIGNKLQASENGGIQTDQDYLNNPIYSNRFAIPTKLGGEAAFSRDFFQSNLVTGNRYKEFYTTLRQQYDLGRKDSLVTDSTVIPLFYPRLRFEHSITYSKNRYEFRDYRADSVYYATFYNTRLSMVSDTLSIRDTWKEVNNDFSIYTFPDAKNLQQFLKVGAQYQLLSGRVKGGQQTFYNIISHGEYRNRTRNQKWDIEAAGQLWLNGYNAGDYHGLIRLQRLLSNKLGSLQAGFENTNRSPFFLFDARSNFYLDNPKSFNKENNTRLFAAIQNPALRLELRGDYYLLSNYLYMADLYKPEQESALFTFLRISALRTFRLGKRWNWYAEIYIQQKTGNAPLNVPLLFTRNRIMYEGNLGFKNLNIAFGTEMRYHTPYKMESYSPVLGQFTYQDSVRISNRPDVHAFMHFRIRSFKAFARLENLNTFQFANGGGFKRHNFAAPDYPYPGLVIRLGIFWSFVN